LPRSRSRSAAREHTFRVVKIYTKTGDAGETGLFGGGRVPKDDLRVRAYGDIDELNATLGFGVALEPADFELATLQTIQRDLFSIGAELATPNPAKLRAAVSADQVSALEQAIDKYEATLAPLKNFILPGGTPKAAAFHLARTTCRRAERSVVTLSRDQQINPVIIHYLNRLSDLLFVLARAVNQQAGRSDIVW
jgi:cob(I)alamin adenosyltransferase